MIPYGRQSISTDDIEAVVRVLKSDYLSCGPEVEAFEQDLASFIGAKHVVAVNSATSALHLAMRVLGIGPGDRVVTSPNTFVASANCAAFVGAVPDFSDINPETFNLDSELLARTWKPDTRAVVAVHYAGVPCNMPAIASVARSHNAYVIEDGCHGIGTSFHAQGREWKVGSHPWTDITTFSFHPVKTMTTGEGGVLVTNNDEWAAKARLLRSHGISRDPADFAGLGVGPQSCQIEPESPTKPSPLASRPTDPLAEHGTWYYEMQQLGYNYRITDIQCALGRSQLRRLPQFIERRQQIAARYTEAICNLDSLTPPTFDCRPSLLDFSYSLPDLSLHLYTVWVDFEKIRKSRTQVMAELREHGIGTQVLYIPAHLQPWYRETYGYGIGKCPCSETYYTGCLSLPLYPAMKDQDIFKVVTAVLSILSKYER